MKRSEPRRLHLPRLTALAFVLVLAACAGQGPPGVDGTQAVVSAHGAATDAGIAILEAGGSAADAAVAVAAALSVVEPWFSSVLGGGTWALYFEAETGVVTSLDGVGPVGSLATVADYGARASEAGIHQANVPGAWDGWMLWLERYGRLPLGDVLAPAIALARDGHPASAAMRQWLVRDAPLVLARPETARIYAPDGALVQVGSVVVQEDLAATLEGLVAAFDDALPAGRPAAFQAARDHFYRGPVADALVAYSDANGGYLTLADFHGFEAAIVDPIHIDYGRGITVYQNPPNSQGITMLLALQILKGFDFSSSSPDDADAVHLQVEALKLAFADRHAHVGDPARVDVPVAALLSDAHADRQRARIAVDAVLTWPIPSILPAAAGAAGVSAAAGGEAAGAAGVSAAAAPAHLPGPGEPTGTTTFHILDRDGNAAAVTTSLGAQFLVVGDTGIHINNRMRFIALADGDPNQLTPGFKVRHTSNPYLALRGGRPYLLGGNTGADVQVQAQVQQFLHVVEFGLTVAEATARPRFLTSAFPATTYPYAFGDTLRLEGLGPPGLIEALEAIGHSVSAVPAGVGVAQMLLVGPGGVEVGTDPRYPTSTGVVIAPH